MGEAEYIGLIALFFGVCHIIATTGGKTTMDWQPAYIKPIDDTLVLAHVRPGRFTDQKDIYVVLRWYSKHWCWEDDYGEEFKREVLMWSYIEGPKDKG